MKSKKKHKKLLESKNIKQEKKCFVKKALFSHEMSQIFLHLCLLDKEMTQRD